MSRPRATRRRQPSRQPFAIQSRSHGSKRTVKVSWLAGAGLVGAGLLAVAVVAFKPPSPSPGDDVRRVLIASADSLDAALAELGTSIVAGADVRVQFRAARAQYKRIEPALEFYAPALAATFNSRRQEVDDEDAPPPSTLGPSGFPALEDFVWPAVVAGRADSARKVVSAMRPAVARVRALAGAITPTDAQLVELTRLGLVRVSTMGIAGFDAPRTGEAMRECAESLEGVRALYAAAGARWPRLRAERRALDSTLSAAVGYLRSHADFVAFDRLAFIAEYSEPAARALNAFRSAAKTTPMLMPRGLRADAVSPYEANAFDVLAYAPLSAPHPTPALVALGRRLFFDPALSGTRTRSCASCHNPAREFADGVAKATNIDPRRGAVARNTPTLINAALQPAQFADERAVALEDQVVLVLQSPAEMASSVEDAARSVSADAGYQREFAAAFAVTSGEAVTQLRLRQALAAYVRSLVALNSRFDQAVRGDTARLTAPERQGFNLFMGKAGCGTCHFSPLFNGNTPPRFVSSDVEVIGTPVSPDQPRRLDADSGRARIDHMAQHLGAFKVPSLRNVAVTAPYMHNGAFGTLDEVVRFYDSGGGSGAGAHVPNQTLAADSLHLTVAERHALVAFLGSLTDTAGLFGRPPARH